MRDYLLIGTVLKPQGIHGESKIKSYAADPEDFRRWKKLYLKDLGGYSPIPCRVTRVHDGFIYAVLKDAKDANEAEALRGQELYIARAQAAPTEKDAVLIADLEGCHAVDEEGQELGVLTEVLQHGPVDTWVFRTEKGTLMAPALKDVFPEVDPEAGVIRVCSARLGEVAVIDD